MEDDKSDQSISMMKATELEELTRAELENRVKRAEKSLHTLEAYNHQLREELELMNAKAHLAKRYLQQNVATQTDIHIPTAEMNGRVFADCIMLPNGEGSEGDAPEDKK